MEDAQKEDVINSIAPVVAWVVAGAGGNLGSHIVKCISDKRPNDRCYALVRRSRPLLSGATNNVEVVSCDATQLDDFQQIIANARQSLQQQTTRQTAAAVVVVVNCVAVPSIQAALEHPGFADEINGQLPGKMARLCVEEEQRDGCCRVQFVHISSDMVFNGEQVVGNDESEYYNERTSCNAATVYGASKAAGEAAVLAASPSAIVARMPLMYGVGHGREKGRQGTFFTQMSELAAGRTVKAFADEFRTPLWLQDAARAVADVALHAARGHAAMPRIINVAGRQRLSRFELVSILQSAVGSGAVEPSLLSEFTAPEPRPKDLSLSTGLYRSVMKKECGRGPQEAMRDAVDHCRSLQSLFQNE